MLYQICRDLVQKKVEMNPIQGSVTTHSTSFKCSICEYSTEMRYSIYKHIKAVHNKEKPIISLLWYQKCVSCLKEAVGLKVMFIHVNLQFALPFIWQTFMLTLFSGCLFPGVRCIWSLDLCLIARETTRDFWTLVCFKGVSVVQRSTRQACQFIGRRITLTPTICARLT